MHSVATVEINRPIDEVFRLTNEHVPEWSIVVTAEEMIHKAPDGGVGTKFRTISESNGRPMTFEGVVTEFDPPHKSAVELTGKLFDITAEYTFLDMHGGVTEVTQTSTVRGKGLMWLFFSLCGWMLNKANCDAAKREMLSLKQFCEQAPTEAL